MAGLPKDRTTAIGWLIFLAWTGVVGLVCLGCGFAGAAGLL